MIEQKIIELAQARKRLEAAKARKAACMEKLQATVYWQSMASDIDQATKDVAALTDEIKAEAVSTYMQTGTKKAHPATGIRMTTEIRYNLDTALRWAREHLVEAITLDRPFFETHAKAVAKTKPVECVEIVQVPSATIATDLSVYLVQTQDAEAILS
jgi:hypothetical protein